MLAAGERADADALRQVGVDAGRLLVPAVLKAPVVPAYYSQIAAHMIAADAGLFGGRYGAALRAGFVRRGVLSPESATSLTAEAIDPHRDGIAAAGPPVVEPALDPVEIDGSAYGVTTTFVCAAPGQAPRFAVAAAADDIGSQLPPSGRRVAQAFVEDLFRQGRVHVDPAYRTAATIVDDASWKSHELADDGGVLRLRRRLFDGGWPR